MQHFGIENVHGNFNGHNLPGLDPLLALNCRSVTELMERQKIAFSLWIPCAKVPDFVRRYPRLLRDNGVFIPGISPEGQKNGPRVLAGWHVSFSGFGMPLKLIALARGEIPSGGGISLASYDRREIEKFGKNRIIILQKNGFLMAKRMRDLLYLLFGIKC
jgi:hypothetical protein